MKNRMLLVCVFCLLTVLLVVAGEKEKPYMLYLSVGGGIAGLVWSFVTNRGRMGYSQ